MSIRGKTINLIDIPLTNRWKGSGGAKNDAVLHTLVIKTLIMGSELVRRWNREFISCFFPLRKRIDRKQRNDFSFKIQPLLTMKEFHREDFIDDIEEHLEV